MIGVHRLQVMITRIDRIRAPFVARNLIRSVIWINRVRNPVHLQWS
jgi:hypothetical protein